MRANLHKTLLAAAGLFFAVLLHPATAHAACVVGVAQLSDNYLSLRTGPGSRFREIRRMRNETELRVLERSGNWRRVRLNDGSTGWAHSSYIGSCGDGHGGGHGAIYHVTGLDRWGDNFLSLRTGPGSRFREVRRMGLGTVVTVLDRRGSWRYVRLSNGRQGWAHGRYLAPGYP